MLSKPHERPNVVLTSLADLRETLAFDIGIAKLRALQDRADLCNERYWELSKSDRIAFRLRPEPGAFGYMGDAVIRAVSHTASRALRHGFPVVYDRTVSSLEAFGGRALTVETDQEGAILSPSDLYDVLDAELTELERRLAIAESEGRRRDATQSRTSD